MWLLKCDAKTCQILFEIRLFFVCFLASHKDIFYKYIYISNTYKNLKNIYKILIKIKITHLFFIEIKNCILLSQKNSVFFYL